MPTVKLPRRAFLHLVAGAAALPAMSRTAKAQAYPARPVRCIVGYAPGGGTDIFVRLVGQVLPARLGQPLSLRTGPEPPPTSRRRPSSVRQPMVRRYSGPTQPPR